MMWVSGRVWNEWQMVGHGCQGWKVSGSMLVAHWMHKQNPCTYSSPSDSNYKLKKIKYLY